MNKVGCLALLLLATAIATVIWLWSQASEFFPSDHVTLYRNVAGAFVVSLALIGLFFLAKPRGTQGASPPGEPLSSRRFSRWRLSFPPALFIIMAAAGTIAWLWLNYRTIFPTSRAEQFQNIAIWGIILITAAGLFRCSSPSRRTFKSVRRSEPHEPRAGNSDPRA